MSLLAGLRVLEIGHFVAAPFATRLLADLGADVIKIEPLTGDPVRQWGEQIEGKSLWWSVHGRNKRSVALNLKKKGAREIVLNLTSKSDAVVENFRPGQLEKMGLGPSALRAARPDVVIARISGYGQSGPHSNRAAFGVISEAVGGLRHLTNHAPGESDLPPVRVGVSIGDSLAGLYAAFGVMAALWRRDRVDGDVGSQVLDIALSDAVLSMMEGMLPEFGALGKIKQPSGSAIATAAPSNLYRTADKQWILIAANSDPLFAKLAVLIGLPELSAQPAFQDNPSRVRNARILDEKIGAWTRRQRADDLADILTQADIPHSKVYTAADCAADPQFLHRGMVRVVSDPTLGEVLHPGIVPHAPCSPGCIRWPGPDIGQHTDEVLRDLLGLKPHSIQALRKQEIVA